MGEPHSNTYTASQAYSQSPNVDSDRHIAAHIHPISISHSFPVSNADPY